MTKPKAAVSFYIINGLFTFSASFIWSVNTLFLLNAGLSLLQTFVVGSVYTATAALFELPTGVVADTRGRRISFIYSVVFLAVGTFGYVFSRDFNWGMTGFIAASVITGIGWTFLSGALEAWVVDEIAHEQSNRDMDQVFARSAMISSGLMIAGSLAGGLLGQIDLGLPFVARGIALLVLLVYALVFMKEQGFSPEKNSSIGYGMRMKRLAAESVKFGWRNLAVRQFVIAGFFLNAFFQWGFYAAQPFLLDKLGSRESIWVAGVITAAVSLASIVGSALLAPARRVIKRRTTILIASSIFGAFTLVALAWLQSFALALTAYLVFMVVQGMARPVRQSYLNKLIPSRQRASVLSFDSLVSSMGNMTGQTSLGAIGDRTSISLGYTVGGALVLLSLPFMVKVRSMDQQEDQISSELN